VVANPISSASGSALALLTVPGLSLDFLDVFLDSIFPDIWRHASMNTARKMSVVERETARPGIRCRCGYRLDDSVDSGSPDATALKLEQLCAGQKDACAQPSNTGEPGGKETGQHMSHYIVAAGPYAQSLRPSSSQRISAPLAVRPRRRARENEACEQNQIHLPGMRAKRLGKA
jgi:hypothetical protein